MIFQRYDNNELQLDVLKLKFYDLIIIILYNFSKKVRDQISLDCLKKLSTIKTKLFEYLGLTSTEVDVFFKEVIIEHVNNKNYIDVPELIDELMQIQKISNDYLDENEFKMKFAEALIFLKRKWFN